MVAFFVIKIINNDDYAANKKAHFRKWAFYLD